MTIRRPLRAEPRKRLSWAGLLLFAVGSACGLDVRPADSAASPGCPAPVQAVVTGFYDWYFQAGGEYRQDLQARKALFEPRLYADLQRAFDLSADPRAGGVLDFDPFSGTQVGSYGYRLLYCRPVGAGVLEARVAVRSGLHPQRASEHPVLLLLKRGAAGWRIQGIDYPQVGDSPERFHLQTQLDQLLADAAPVGADAETTDEAVAQSNVLLTPGFRVEVERHCPEGTVVCDQVSYFGQDRRSGASLRLTGSTSHRLCADGVTPCQFLGYSFRNGNVVYEVSGEGLLRVLQGGKVLLEEQGTWQR